MLNKTVKDLIDDCLNTLSISQPQLASLLCVQEQRLIDLHTVSSHSVGKDVALKRIKTFHEVMTLMVDDGVSPKVFLNYINEPIPGDKQERSMLYYIVDEPRIVVEGNMIGLINRRDMGEL